MRNRRELGKLRTPGCCFACGDPRALRLEPPGSAPFDFVDRALVCTYGKARDIEGALPPVAAKKRCSSFTHRGFAVRIEMSKCRYISIERNDPLERVGDVVDAAARPGIVEVKQSHGLIPFPCHVAGLRVAVKDDFENAGSFGGTGSVCGTTGTPILFGVATGDPRRAVRWNKARARIMKASQQRACRGARRGWKRRANPSLVPADARN